MVSGTSRQITQLGNFSFVARGDSSALPSICIMPIRYVHVADAGAAQLDAGQ